MGGHLVIYMYFHFILCIRYHMEPAVCYQAIGRYAQGDSMWCPRTNLAIKHAEKPSVLAVRAPTKRI